MDISSINPYVRFARKKELLFNDLEYASHDHRIFLVEDGSAKFTLNDRDYTLAKGDVIYWHAGTKYKVKLFEDAIISGCNFDFIVKSGDLSPIPPIRFCDFDGCLVENFKFSDTKFFDDVFIIYSAFILVDRFHEIYKEFGERQVFYENRCSALLKDILTTAARMDSVNHTSKSNTLAIEILSYVKNHYSEKITNKTIAEKFHYHPNYISELVKNQTGMPLHKYVLTHRVYTGLHLLQSTKAPIRDIAEMVGFSDVHHFSNAFKEIIGSSPGEFRIKN